jgi:3-oxoacyl-[acyl-carrier protein] reductase
LAQFIVNYSTDEKRAQETAAEIERAGSVAIAVRADISKVADIDRLFAASLEKFGRLDIVVANAGVKLVGQSALTFACLPISARLPAGLTRRFL